MSPSINAASIPVQWSGALEALPTMSIHTYMCMVLTRLCLLPVGIEGRLHRRPIWRQAQQQHGVLLECPSKPSAAWRPAHGAFVTSFVVPLGKLRSRSRAAAATGLSLDEVAAEAKRASEMVGTMGVALSVCTLPGQVTSDRLGPGKMELGLGIVSHFHGVIAFLMPKVHWTYF